MKRHFLLPLAALLIAASSFAQTKLDFSHVRAVEKQDSLQGTAASIQLDKPAGALLMNTGNVIVMVNAKVATHAPSTSSAKDPTVDVDLEITMKAANQKETKHVAKVFHMGTDGIETVKQPFEFQTGANTRTIMLTFNVAIE